MKKVDWAELVFGAAALGMAIAWLVAFLGIKYWGWQPHENTELVLNLEIATFVFLSIFGVERLIRDIVRMWKGRE